jgi:hypothetical protein
MLYSQMIDDDIESKIITSQSKSQDLANKTALNQAQLVTLEEATEIDGPGEELVDQELMLQATEKMHSKNKTNLQSTLVEIEDPQSDDEIGKDKLFSMQLKNSLEVSSDYKEFRDPSEEDSSKEKAYNPELLNRKAPSNDDLLMEAFLLFKSGILTQNQYKDIKANGFDAESYKNSSFIKTRSVAQEPVLNISSSKSTTSLDSSFVNYLAKSKGEITSSEYDTLQKLEKAKKQATLTLGLINPINFQAQSLIA